MAIDPRAHPAHTEKKKQTSGFPNYIKFTNFCQFHTILLLGLQSQIFSPSRLQQLCPSSGSPKGLHGPQTLPGEPHNLNFRFTSTPWVPVPQGCSLWTAMPCTPRRARSPPGVTGTVLQALTGARRLIKATAVKITDKQGGSLAHRVLFPLLRCRRVPRAVVAAPKCRNVAAGRWDWKDLLLGPGGVVEAGEAGVTTSRGVTTPVLSPTPPCLAEGHSSVRSRWVHPREAAPAKGTRSFNSALAQGWVCRSPSRGQDPRVLGG